MALQDCRMPHVRMRRTLQINNSKKKEEFKNMPVLRALLDETKKQGSLLAPETTVSSNFINTGL